MDRVTHSVEASWRCRQHEKRQAYSVWQAMCMQATQEQLEQNCHQEVGQKLQGQSTAQAGHLEGRWGRTVIVSSCRSVHHRGI